MNPRKGRICGVQILLERLFWTPSSRKNFWEACRPFVRLFCKVGCCASPSPEIRKLGCDAKFFVLVRKSTSSHHLKCIMPVGFGSLAPSI
mmetsp:Transcript_12086/g.34565  ORF Transcript_12086/g.34565 Transcript_12086/m.34565 type:complete len:90 (+) Transcript_12086:2303-2572(+)